MIAAVLTSAWFVPLLTTAAILLVAPLFIGYLSLVERKLLADFQLRYGPMRVGPHGLLQPLADALKFLLKEDIVPTDAERALFLLAPVLGMVVGLLGLALLPFTSTIFVSDLNIGLLLIASFSAISVLAVIVGGWASNSNYPLLGALRSAAQLVSYEVALTLALLAGVMVAGTLSLRTMVEEQQQRHIWFACSNLGARLVPFAVYVIASVAETNRSPFDLPEAESELVAGYHTEFSGFRFALWMLAEWANILVLAAVAITLFLGGWLRPFPSIALLAFPLDAAFPFATFAAIAAYCVKLGRRQLFVYERAILFGLAAALLFLALLFFAPPLQTQLSSLFWFFAKLTIFIYGYIWLRATLPRMRYDQLMSLGWKWLIPIALAAIALNSVLGIL